jgi:hypothetical protein
MLINAQIFPLKFYLAYVNFNPIWTEYSLAVCLAEVYTENNLNWKQEYCPLHKERNEKTHANVGAFLSRCETKFR